jgi:hypothetical protein
MVVLVPADQAGLHSLRSGEQSETVRLASLAACGRLLANGRKHGKSCWVTYTSAMRHDPRLSSSQGNSVNKRLRITLERSTSQA